MTEHAFTFFWSFLLGLFVGVIITYHNAFNLYDVLCKL